MPQRKKKKYTVTFEPSGLKVTVDEGTTLLKAANKAYKSFVPKNVVRSPLLGKGGSIEFFFHLVINNNDVIQETKRNIEKTIISLFQDN